MSARLTVPAAVLSAIWRCNLHRALSCVCPGRSEVEVLHKTLLEVQMEMDTISNELKKSSSFKSFWNASNTDGLCTLTPLSPDGNVSHADVVPLSFVSDRLSDLLKRLQAVQQAVLLKLNERQYQEVRQLNIAEQEKANALSQIADVNARTFWANKLGREVHHVSTQLHAIIEMTRHVRC